MTRETFVTCLSLTEPKSYLCSCWNTLTRVISWNNVTIFIRSDIIQIHWYLVTPNTITVNQIIALYLIFLNQAIRGLANHFNSALTSNKLIIHAIVDTRGAFMTNGVAVIIRYNRTHEYTRRLELILNSNVTSCYGNDIIIHITPKRIDKDTLVLAQNLRKVIQVGTFLELVWAVEHRLVITLIHEITRLLRQNANIGKVNVDMHGMSASRYGENHIITCLVGDSRIPPIFVIYLQISVLIKEQPLTWKISNRSITIIFAFSRK